MASTTQIANFVTQYYPTANQIGGEIGVDPNVLLGQFGMETGYGTEMSGTNNLGNITDGGAPNFVSYGSTNDFANAFTNLISSDYPQATNTGSDVNAYVSGLGSGTQGSYFGSQSPSSYASALSGAESTIQGVESTLGLGGSSGSSSPLSAITGVLGGLGGSSGGADNGLIGNPGFGGAAPSGWGALASELAIRAGLILLGMVFIAGGLYLLGRNDHETVSLDLAKTAKGVFS